jgi:hypothetical protein
MDWGSSKEGVQDRGRILYLTGSVPGSPVAGVLGNKLATLGVPLLPTFLYIMYILIRSRDSIVGIATAYGLDDLGVGVRVPLGSRIFSLHVVQTGSGVHRTSYPRGTGGSFPRG